MSWLLKLLLSLAVSFLFFGIAYPLIQVFGSDIKFVLFGQAFDLTIIFAIIGIIIGIFFFFFFSSKAIKKIIYFEGLAEEKLIAMNFGELISSTIGAIVGLILANLMGISISKIPIVGTFLVIILNLLLGFIGFRVAKKRKDDFKVLSSKTSKSEKTAGRAKILDTSVIIDGRILDILQTGFIEGKIIIPEFVLEELRYIADSSDSLKRNRGRRGLDILNEIQKQTNIPVEIVGWDKKDDDDVDTKLLKLGAKLDAFVVTNDFNLNKVASFRKVHVLNINELSKAVKAVVLPGENMEVTIIKDGKENHQGIAYLVDGTMIVIEGGNKFLGETKIVEVTSVLQTAAGRMIFAKTIK